MADLHLGLLSADLTHRHGWAQYSVNMATALRRAGVCLTIVAPQNSPTQLDALPDVPIAAILPNVDPLAGGLLMGSLRALPRARQMLRDVDLLHSFVELFAPLGALIARDRPLLVTGHGSYVRIDRMRRPPSRWLYAAALRRALLICVSDYTARSAQRAIPGIPTRVIPNGIDNARFANIPRHPDPDPLVIAVGGVKPRKGTLELIHAFGHVRAALSRARLVIAGSLTDDPAYVAEVRSAIDRVGLGDAVTLVGRLDPDALRNLYARAWLMALPAVQTDWRFEGFGLVLLEAAAAGLPVVTSDRGGTADAVVAGETGLIVHDLVTELPAALLQLLTDATLRARMGERGREHAAAMTWDRAAAALIAAYRELLAR